MGVAYLAEDTRLKRRVVLKCVSEKSGWDPDARRQLLNEAEAAARISHPNVAAIYDVLETAGDVHIVMEYAEGVTLAERLREGPLPVSTVVAIGRQLADALSKAHAMGVVHRDLKPANVILKAEGQIKILDFGLATVRALRAPNPGSTTASVLPEGLQIAGTVGYIPPETLLGQPPDARGDIYSLGVLLFELLTGRRPFPGQDVVAVGLAALAEPTPKARQFDPTVPASLELILGKAMARDPAHRYGSAAELRAALDRQAAALASGRRFRLRTWREAMSSRPALPLVAGSVALALLVLALALWLVRPSIPPSGEGRTVAVLPILNATGYEADGPLAIGVSDVLSSTFAQLPGVNMISRGASLDSKQQDRPISSIARDLGVDAIVVGEVRRAGDGARIQLELHRAGTEQVAWRRTYDGAFGDFARMQSEAGSALADLLNLPLTRADRSRLAEVASANVESLADYAQAVSFLERSDESGNVDHSIGLFLSAIAKDPRSARAQAGLGRAYWQKYLETRDESWSEKSLWATMESLRLDPDDTSARQAVATIYAGTGRSEEAVEELRRVVSAQPRNDAAHGLLGRMLFERGLREQGLLELRRAIALRPAYWHHHYALGVAYFEAGRYPDAIAAFRRVTELQPDSTRGFQMLGTTYYASGDVDLATENYRRALAIGPDSGAYTNLGVALYAAQDFEGATEAFEEAARLAPNFPEKHRNLGDAYRRLGREQEAEIAYARAIELCEAQLRTNPQDVLALARLAVYEAKSGLREDAERHAAAAVELGPSSADAHYRQAVVSALSGRAEDALASLEKALALGFSPELARTDEDLGALRERAHDRERFLRLLGTEGGEER